MGECIEGKGIVPEVADIEDSFGVGQIESRQIGIETRVRGSEIWNSRGCAYACACLHSLVKNMRVC